MKKLMELMAEELASAFEKAGYDPSYGKVTVSNRPDLCEYQCNGAMAGAKAYKKAPFMIADDVVVYLKDSKIFSMAEVVKPGFINLRVREEFLADYLKEMEADPKYSVKTAETPKTIIIDYGGPNVAKPLHVGHLRSAIIGESIKRIGRYVGHKVIGDVHLGDWGLQMGLIITELKHRKPELVYFDDSYQGEYPQEAPFTISELEEIYPCASGKSKVDEEYRNEALEATHQLQQGKARLHGSLEPHHAGFRNRPQEKLRKSECILRSLEKGIRRTAIHSGYGADDERPGLRIRRSGSTRCRCQRRIQTPKKSRHVCFLNPTEHPFIQQQTLQRS